MLCLCGFELCSRWVPLSISQLLKDLPIFPHPSPSRSFVKAISHFYQIPYVLRDERVWFMLYFHSFNRGMVVQTRQQQVIKCIKTIIGGFIYQVHGIPWDMRDVICKLIGFIIPKTTCDNVGWGLLG